MPFFTRLPTDTNLIEARQWFPGLQVAGVADEVPAFAGNDSLLPMSPHAYLTSRKGRITVFAGDWVITEPTGDQHICQDRLFRMSYTLAENKFARLPLPGLAPGEQAPPR
ncbi:hypothetical protein [Hymenobacter siberiensis]|uniref:hypothetical protein n=1 Tax=Hymenobacter siberiensis TaxID=2848396 RepID=UPI001C1E6552|nr:hypothetical protein [Hymenobacter siberiensis]